LDHDDDLGSFEFADANFTIISGMMLLSDTIDQTTFVSPLVFYVRPKAAVAGDGNTVTITATLTDAAGVLLQDILKVIASALPLVDLDIFNGQYQAPSGGNPGSRAVQEKHEETIGSFTVANQNDTNGNNTTDKGENPVPGEIDLMKLVLWKPWPDSGGNVTLQFSSQTQAIGSAVKLWTDSTKTTAITLTDGAATFPISSLSTAAGGWFRKEVWVELPFESPVVKDITITLSYNGKQDKVAATGIWAVQTVNGFKNQNSDSLWADAGEPLTDTFNNRLGKFGINYAAPDGFLHYSMGMEFKIIPSAKGKDWDKWRVKFDVTRQRENISWDLSGGVFVKDADFSEFWPGRTSYTTAGPTGTNIDEANDQVSGNNTDNDNITQNDHVYSIDGPGRGNTGTFAQFVDQF